MLKSVEEFVFKPTYERNERGIRVLAVDQIPTPVGFVPGPPPQIVSIEPGGWGGNHRHQRREVWVGYGEGLVLVWRDEKGERHESKMVQKDGKLRAFAVAPLVPHMIENRGDAVAVLYELSDVSDDPDQPLAGDESLRRSNA